MTSTRVTQIVAVDAVFDEEDAQAAGADERGGEEAALGAVRAERGPVGRLGPVAGHPQQLQHGQHVHLRADQERDEDLLVDGCARAHTHTQNKTKTEKKPFKSPVTRTTKRMNATNYRACAC